MFTQQYIQFVDMFLTSFTDLSTIYGKYNMNAIMIILFCIVLL